VALSSARRSGCNRDSNIEGTIRKAKCIEREKMRVERGIWRVEWGMAIADCACLLRDAGKIVVKRRVGDACAFRVANRGRAVSAEGGDREGHRDAVIAMRLDHCAA